MSYTPPTGPATSSKLGTVQLSGDLSGTATAPVVAKVGGVAAANIANTSKLTGVVAESGGSYPARPTGFANVKFIGADDPGALAQNGDEWVKLA